MSPFGLLPLSESRGLRRVIIFEGYAEPDRVNTVFNPVDLGLGPCQVRVVEHS